MKVKILVIEDNEQNMYLVTFILEKRGYQVVQAWDGREGIELASQAKPTLILLDIQLPEMDGFEVARRIREDPDSSDLPIIMVTALTSKEDRLRAVQAGANDFITKPVDKTELRVRTASLLKMKDVILLKPGKLDKDEWDSIKQHSTIGSHILSGSSSELLQAGEIIALSQHEKWDGSGSSI